MAKVKKSAGLTGERNVKASKPAASVKRGSKPAPAKGAATRKTARKTARKTMTTKRAQKAGGSVAGKAPRARLAMVRGRAKAEKPAPVVRVAVKELDPQRKCGVGTSVQFLYRVDESVDGRSTPHLVFFDRHGWYCEHGRACPAVMHARKYNGQIARVS
ncbi:MAG TPA: hypothetical protein VGG84_04625 [Gemmatimonadaceae bacterium]